LDSVNGSPAGIEKRKFQRLALGIPIHIPHLQKTLLCTNLSIKGCFLPESNLAQPGTCFPLLIDLPGMGKITVEGQVIHSGKDEEGTGIDFIKIDPGDEVFLSKFLAIFLA
jgi:hypothetical protein